MRLVLLVSALLVFSGCLTNAPQDIDPIGDEADVGDLLTAMELRLDCHQFHADLPLTDDQVGALLPSGFAFDDTRGFQLAMHSSFCGADREAWFVIPVEAPVADGRMHWAGVSGYGTGVFESLYTEHLDATPFMATAIEEGATLSFGAHRFAPAATPSSGTFDGLEHVRWFGTPGEPVTAVQEHTWSDATNAAFGSAVYAGPGDGWPAALPATFHATTDMAASWVWAKELLDSAPAG